MATGESDFVFLILTHMEDDGCTFWAQQHSPTIKLDLEHVTRRIEKLSSSKTCILNDPLKGQVYGCKFIDESWYRCKVLFSISKNKYLVQYIDYGNCEEKVQGNLLELPIDLQESSMPAMAHRFRLHDVHVDHEKVEIVQKCIENMCSDNFVKAELKSSLQTAPIDVILYDDEGKSVCELLVKTGLAKTAADAEAKKSVNVIMSPPVISRAQKYRNPLLSSSDESGDDCNNNRFRKLFPGKGKISSQSSGLDSMTEGEIDSGPKGDGDRKKKMIQKLQCDACQENKDEVQRMRLSMIKLQHDIVDNRHKISELIEKEAVWKKKYMELKEQQIRKETHLEQQPDSTSDEEKVITIEPQQKPETPVSKHLSSNSITEIESVQRKSLIKKFDVDSSARANGIMKKIILPTFDFTKKLASSSKTIEDCRKYDQNLKEIVEKIKVQIKSKANQNADGFLSLIAQRNAVLQDLQQTIPSILPLISIPEDELLKEKVKNFLNPLKKLAEDYGLENIEGDLGIFDVNEAIQNWKVDKENTGDISNIISTLTACLSNVSNKLFTAGDFLAKVKPMQDNIASLQSQEKVIKEVSDEMKSIRKKKQKIRLAIATLKNLEEDEADADQSEKQALKTEKDKVSKELTALRGDIHECFENKWILMESLADMAENFSPELQTEHPELGIEEYINGKGIVMNEMEPDHFDIKSIDWNAALKVECYTTDYRGQSIILNKYDSRLLSDSAWDQIMTDIAIYTNVECQTAIVPMGIFTYKDATYVMVTAPQHQSVTLPKKKGINKEMARNILKDIAAALSALHENGIYHGQVTASAVVVSVQPPHQACLSIPNFSTRSSGTQETMDDKACTPSLADDLYKFGSLAKILDEKTEGDQAFGDVVDLCHQKSTGATMQSILEVL